jgi:type IV secretory pathway TrbL component
MAKKEKVQLTPEELAEKKLNTRKGWARVGAIVCALAITVAVYAAGSKGGHKIKQVEENVPVVTQIVTVAAPTAPTTEPTTQAPTTQAPTTQAPTTQASSSGSDSALGGIMDTLSGLIGGMGDIDISGAGDTIEGLGNTAKDFFYDIADKIENGGDIGDIGGDIIGGVGK